MTSWLEPVVAALAVRTTPIRIFFRDDDAGWDDAALWALLDEFDGAGVPVDVAAIPAAMTAATGRALAAWTGGGLVHVHQHGWSHENHEPVGRKCEFGPSRSVEAQAADIAAGRARLQDAVGPLEPVFTPPWNRCRDETADAVLAAGHRVLSRDVSAGTIGRPGLVEVPVAVDWCARPAGVRLTATEVGRRAAEAIGGGGPVGVMLHHAAMDADDRRAVRQLLDLLATSPAAAPTTILGASDPPLSA